MSKPAFSRAEPDARRQSLIEATARVLARDGATGASVRAIALEAGVSPGLVGHYFAGIDGLVAETYAAVGQQVHVALAAAVAAAGDDPRARVVAYVTASFAPPIADRALFATCIAFWSLSAKPIIAARHDALYQSYRDDLERCSPPAGCLRPTVGWRRSRSPRWSTGYGWNCACRRAISPPARRVSSPSGSWKVISTDRRRAGGNNGFPVRSSKSGCVRSGRG